MSTVAFLDGCKLGVIYILYQVLHSPIMSNRIYQIVPIVGMEKGAFFLEFPSHNQNLEASPQPTNTEPNKLEMPRSRYNETDGLVHLYSQTDLRSVKIKMMTPPHFDAVKAVTFMPNPLIIHFIPRS